MTDITFAMEAKSDQLNAADIMGIDRIIKIRDVVVTKSDQPISVFFDGDNNRPFKPSKGMIRILGGAWGTKSKDWIGKSASLYFEPSVIYGGKPVGGIRIKAVSDIDPKGLNFSISINRTKREPFPVACLIVQEKDYPSEHFNKALPKMIEAMQDGKMTLQGVIAQCQKTGTLSAEQLETLQKSAPQEIDEMPHKEESNEPAIGDTY
jgi:hypothetical protein